MRKRLSKIIVILGPTASGKSKLAVKIALRLGSGQAKKKYKINGAEIISADSRQVYKGMDIGTGKITPDTKNSSNFSTGQAKKKYIFTHKRIPHYCIDVASPKRRFTVAQYRKLALAAINKIFRKERLPILCGGTGFYIQAVVDGIVIPRVPPDWKLRKKLEKKTAAELYKILKKLDPKRAKTIERKSSRRLIRAIEIVMKINGPVPILKKNPLPYPILIIGLKLSKKQLEKRIKKRVEKMFKLGLEKEAKKFPREIIGYQEWKDYFDGKINKKWVKDLIEIHTLQYAKRQMTWFKKDKRIRWIKNYKEAKTLVKEFLI